MAPAESLGGLIKINIDKTDAFIFCRGNVSDSEAYSIYYMNGNPVIFVDSALGSLLD